MTFAQVAETMAALLVLSWWGGYALLGMVRARELAAGLHRNTPTRLRRGRPWGNLALWLGTSVVAGFLLAPPPEVPGTAQDRPPPSVATARTEGPP